MSARHTRVLLIVLAGLFVLCFSRVMQVSLRSDETHDRRKIVRIGHYLLHSGVREALQEVIDEYERQHPDIHLLQVPVPERTYLQFLRTQLVAGMAPDILQIGAHFTGMDELRARYFWPITAAVEEVNPYNANTALARLRWRDTFVDGLDNTEAYSEASRFFYGVPLSVAGVRIFYNLQLLRKITGAERLPQTYSALIALCHQVEVYARSHGVPLVPFAGSRLSALFLMSPLVSNVSQRLYYEMASDHSLRVTEWGYGLAYLRGRWSFDTPAIRHSFALARELAQYQKPGFYQLAASDATMQFLQGQSLMLTAYGLDVSNLKAQAHFPIGAAPVPTISPSDPTYGADVLGPVSELSVKATSNLGIIASSRYKAEALDFLRFLGSKPGMEIFTKHSNWLPSVINVEVPDWMKPMQPVQVGYAGRFFAEYAGKGDARFVIGNQLHLLVGQGGSVDAFIAMAREYYGPAMRSDLAKDNREAAANLRRQETFLCAMYLQTATDVGAHAAYWRDISSQNGYEARMLQVRLILAHSPFVTPDNAPP